MKKSILLVAILTLFVMQSCAHTPRVVVPANKPARLEKIDLWTRQALVIYRDVESGEVRRGWVPLDELLSRTFISEDGWLSEGQ